MIYTFLQIRVPYFIFLTLTNISITKLLCVLFIRTQKTTSTTPLIVSFNIIVAIFANTLINFKHSRLSNLSILNSRAIQSTNFKFLWPGIRRLTRTFSYLKCPIPIIKTYYRIFRTRDTRINLRTVQIRALVSLPIHLLIPIVYILKQSAVTWSNVACPTTKKMGRPVLFGTTDFAFPIAGVCGSGDCGIIRAFYYQLMAFYPIGGVYA